MKRVMRGDIIYTPDMNEMICVENGYLVYENGVVKGVYDTLSDEDATAIYEDYKGCLIIPGFNDIHLHAPQWRNCGIGYSEELLPWLNKYTFPLEAEFEDTKLAEELYRGFLRDLILYGTTRACMFATRHEEATKILFEQVRRSGIGAYIGKVNMDRNSIERLQETTQASLTETERLVNWVEETRENDRVNYILTPRFVPSTTTELMKGLGKIQERYGLMVQSHLNENVDEVAWVSQLHPECASFASVYYDYGLMPKKKTVLAHCIHNTEEEAKLLRDQEVLFAHCASSNMNLSSGIMPLRRYLKEGQRIGLATDISASESVSMARTIVSTIQASKIHWCQHPQEPAISFKEAFYLATKGSGQLFGKVGSFEAGYEMDALVIRDQEQSQDAALSLAERLERYVYMEDPKQIVVRMVHGEKIQIPE